MRACVCACVCVSPQSKAGGRDDIQTYNIRYIIPQKKGEEGSRLGDVTPYKRPGRKKTSMAQYTYCRAGTSNTYAIGVNIYTIDSTIRKH